MTSFTEQLSAAPSSPWLLVQGMAHRWLDFGSRVAALQLAASRTTLARQQQNTQALLAAQGTPLPSLMSELAQQQWCALAAYGRAWFDIVYGDMPTPGAAMPAAAPLALDAPVAPVLQMVSTAAEPEEAANAAVCAAPVETPLLVLAAPPDPEQAPAPVALPTPPTSGKGSSRRRK